VPGASGWMTTTLAPGQYELVCNPSPPVLDASPRLPASSILASPAIGRVLPERQTDPRPYRGVRLHQPEALVALAMLALAGYCLAERLQSDPRIGQGAVCLPGVRVSVRIDQCPWAAWRRRCLTAPVPM